MWPKKEKENRQLLIKWTNLIPYARNLQECVETVLLLTSTPLVFVISTYTSYLQKLRKPHSSG